MVLHYLLDYQNHSYCLLCSYQDHNLAVERVLIFEFHLSSHLNNYFQSNDKPILNKKRETSSKKTVEDNEIIKNIKEVLDTKIRPAVARDGGDIKFKSFKKGVVEVELRGSCSGCPSAAMTLKQGVQNLLKHYVKEVNKVEAI